jgi:colanic acid/amylovoran biosynthesis protein
MKQTDSFPSRGRESSQNRFLFVGNGSYLNRGCEAILRGTVKILRATFGPCQCVNANFDVTDPPFAPTESDPDVMHRPLAPVRRMTARWVAAQTADRLCPVLGRYVRFGTLREELLMSKLVLSIGGDNYTLDYGIPWMYVNLDRYILASGKPLVLWGASVGPFDREAKFGRMIHRHLRREITAVFVREERSRAYLEEQGITRNVHLMPDPAFVMDPEPVSDSTIGWELPSEAIGVNVSPLMAKYVTNGDQAAWRNIGVEIVRKLLQTQGRPVILIPHVTSPHSDDHLFLRQIQLQLSSERVAILPKTLSAANIKYVISRLSCLIAARTHATIASFSTGVPTVSLAYSRKAWGINEMLFGHSRYVVAPNAMTPDTVLETVARVFADARWIRGCLSDKMTTISRDAMAAGHALQRVVACNQGSGGEGS